MALALFAQSGMPAFDVPFKFPLFLSGNFAEVRSNHFHAGLDFKTQGVSGKPIYVIADGSIVRVKVSPGGYGRALYVLHDNGYMTVYGHLSRFPEVIDAEVRAKQYADEVFAVDISFTAGKYRVKRGDILARAGNTGYSFGPHLHFEVRSADGEELYNPMALYKKNVTDTRPPVAHAIALYPREGRGVVANTTNNVVCKVQNGSLPDTLTVWGHVGFGVRATDYMDGTQNKYGVYEAELYVDDSLRFSSRMDNFSYSENRLINAWVDYEQYVLGKGDFLRSFLLPNNPLRMLQADDAGGWVNFDEERLYKVEYRLRDYHGNTVVYNFFVEGRACDIPVAGEKRIKWYIDNRIFADGLTLEIPRGALFESVNLDVQVEYDSISPIYKIGGEYYPLWHKAHLTIDVPQAMRSLADKCYIKRVAGKKSYYAGGVVEDGAIFADIYNLGTYTVAVDTVGPRLKALNEKQWPVKGRIRFTLTDKESAIASFKGYIDDKFVLFEYSSKTGELVCDAKREGVKAGKHQLKVVATDDLGNITVVEKTINIR